MIVTVLIYSGTLWSQTAQHRRDTTPAGWVNPFLGTGSVDDGLSGNTYPGATMPFGMVQLSPDTREVPDWSTGAGYNYNDKHIYGFSHTHLSGTGATDFFDILIMPFSGIPQFPVRSAFSHNNESARAGYYQVQLEDYKVNAELTTTTHVGFHRYTYTPGNTNHLYLDLNHSIEKGSWGCRIIAAQLRMVNDSVMEGYRIITGWAPLRRIYFHIEFSQPVTHYEMIDGNNISDNMPLINGTDLKTILDFKESKDPLLVKVGLSAVSTEHAGENLKAELPHWDFDQAATDAFRNWNKELSKITIKGSDSQKEIFYTALYHTFIQPNEVSDVDGTYTAIDQSTKKVNDGQYYSTFSLWDIYRATSPLYSLTQPQKLAGFVNSMIFHYQTFGFLPVWTLWGQENYCMIGNHAIPVITNAILNHTPGINAEKAYEAVKTSSTLNHTNSPFDIWEKYGYMPENRQTQSVSLTLEMSYDDWCVAQLAKKLGKIDDYHNFIQRSAFYKNVFDPKTGFFRGRDDKGNWLEPFNPLEYGANGGHPFVEGNAWQYLWYVPHNIPSLVQLLGGKTNFASKLDSFFTLNSSRENKNDNASGFIGQYAHGNEPSHHVAYLYNYAGQPWKTQYYVSKILKEMYNTASSGYSGNEDCGQMSAWYVLSAMGIYPVNPSSGIYMIGTPVLNEAQLQLASGKTFTIIANKVSDENMYIQSVKLNGKAYTRNYITQKDITNGGILAFTMGASPNKRWGVSIQDMPPESTFND